VNKEEAKRILVGYRPGFTEVRDPEVAEALKTVRRHPDLQLWLQEQTAFHELISTELRRIQPPPDLKEKILAQHNVVVPLWHRPALLLQAACFAAALIIAALWGHSRSEEEGFANFQKRMLGFALRVYRMDIEANSLAQVQQFLVSQNVPTAYTLTPALLNTPVKGGAALAWQGHPVAMICFALPNQQTAWMFVMNQSAIRNGMVPGSVPVYQTIKGLPTASWCHDGQIYVLAAPHMADLDRLLTVTKSG
jgi:hypothetical protein